MTLARGNIGGYEFDRMVLLFSMMDTGLKRYEAPWHYPAQHRFS